MIYPSLCDYYWAALALSNAMTYATVARMQRTC